jgi:hypothetical protein
MRRRPFFGPGVRPASPEAGENGVDGSGHLERGAHLVQHLLVPGAQLFAAEAEEAALLAGVVRRLGLGQQPTAAPFTWLPSAIGQQRSMVQPSPTGEEHR